MTDNRSYAGGYPHGKTFLKDPDDVETYYIIWCSPDNTNDGSATDTGRLQSETISSDTWTVATGITKDSDSESNGIVTAWLSGGTAEETYKVECKITTSASRTDERTILVKVMER